MKKKQCYLCHKTYDMSHFEPKVNKYGKVSYLCKVNIERYKETNGRKPAEKDYSIKRILNKDTVNLKYKDNILKNRFGINLEQFNEMLAQQNNCCAICGKNQEDLKRYLSVDHCHQTGKVRSLLCNSCNAALGLFQESIEFLEKALNYLKKSENVHAV